MIFLRASALSIFAWLILAPVVRAEEDPVFLDKKMSEWIVMLKEDATPRKRQAAVVALTRIGAGNSECMPMVLTVIGKALRDDANATVRRQAATALGQQKLDDLAAAGLDLIAAMRSEKEPAVRIAIAVALGRLGPLAKEATPALIAALSDSDAALRAAGADALGRIGPDAAAATIKLLPLLQDKDSGVKSAVVFALGRIAPQPTAPVANALLELLKDTDRKNTTLRREIVLSLGFLGDTSEPVVKAMSGLLTDPDTEFRSLAILTLSRFGPTIRTVEADLTKVFETDTNTQIRISAIHALCVGLETDAPRLIGLLTKRLKADPDFEVRVAIAEELGAMGKAGEPAIPALRLARGDPQIKVREAATDAIRAIEKPPAPEEKKE